MVEIKFKKKNKLLVIYTNVLRSELERDGNPSEFMSEFGVNSQRTNVGRIFQDRTSIKCIMEFGFAKISLRVEKKNY